MQEVHEPDGPEQAVQFSGQFVQTPSAFMYYVLEQTHVPLDRVKDTSLHALQTPV